MNEWVAVLAVVMAFIGGVAVATSVGIWLAERRRDEGA